MPSIPVSHNACSVSFGRCFPRVNVSYWIEIDRGDFSCSDIVGEFSIIDPSFQVDTYGTHLCSDRSLVRNYSVRRCFVEFMQRLPPHLDGVPCSLAVLSSHFEVAPNRSSIYNCRCCFNPLKGEPIPSIDFRLSLGVECLGVSTNRKDTQK